MSQDMSTLNEPELHTGAPLLFPESDSALAAGQQGGFRQIGHFIANYSDRRAEAKFAYEQLESSLITPLPTFRSRCSGLSSLITGPRRNGDDKQRDEKVPRGRDTRGGDKTSINEKENEMLGSIVESVEGKANGPGKEDQSLWRGLKGSGMKKVIRCLNLLEHVASFWRGTDVEQDVLYLMIVKAPTSQPPSELASCDNSPAPEECAYSYRQVKRIKIPPAVLEPDPFQQHGVWAPDLGAGWLPNESERYQPPSGY